MKTNCALVRAALAILLVAFLTMNVRAQTGFTELTSTAPWPGARFVLELGGLPDMTGDGIGEFYVLQDGRIDVFDGQNLPSLYGLEGRSMISVCSAGDLNGDGIPDLMFGAFASFGNFAGRAVFIDGSGSTPGGGAPGTILAARMFYLEPPNPVNSGYFGKTLRLLPDMTGDG